jgi:hypothetical protein
LMVLSAASSTLMAPCVLFLEPGARIPVLYSNIPSNPLLPLERLPIITHSWQEALPCRPVHHAHKFQRELLGQTTAINHLRLYHHLRPSASSAQTLAQTRTLSAANCKILHTRGNFLLRVRSADDIMKTCKQLRHESARIYFLVEEK